MSTTKSPAPVATGTDPGLYNPVVGPVGPLDVAPEPVPAGPGLGITATVPTPVPVVTIQTETVNVAAATDSSFTANTISTNTVVKYLSVSDESVAINGQVTNINFVGTGVSVANNANALNSVVVTIGGGATYGNSNVVTLLAGFGSNSISTTGNVTVGYVLGNGSQLTGLPATYSNSNVQAYLPTYSGNIGALTVTGNLTVTGTTSTVNTEVVNVSESVVGNIDAGNLRTAGQVSAAGNITGAYFVGNGSALSSLTGGNVSGTVANATYALTSNAATYSTQATTADTANAVAGANVSGTVANATYALNSNAATYSTQATYADTANAVAGANVSGTVANATYALTSNAASYSTQATTADTANAVAGANVSGTVANATYATSAGSATTANTVTDGAQANITSVGILTSLSVSGNITTTANVAANYIVLSGGLVGSGASPAPSISGFSTISAVGNITGGNLLTAGLISTSGNITANNLGNISTINLTGSSTNVLYGNGTFAPAAGGAANTGNVTFNDVNIIGTGNLHLQPDSANTGSYLDIYLTVGPDIHIAKTDANVILGSDTSANVTVGTNGNVYIQASTGTAHTWAFDTTGNLTLPGNTFTVNYANGTAVSLGGGSSYGNADVAANLAAFGTNPISTTGNITGGNIDASGIVSASGNVRGANFNTVGLISATGNVTGNYIIGNGSQLTSLPSPTPTEDTGNTDTFVMVTSGALNYTGHVTIKPLSGDITTLGNIATGTLSASGNVTAGNISTSGSNGNITGANVITATTFSATGTASNLVRRANTIGAANAVVTLDNITAQLGGAPTRLYIGAANSNMTMAGTSQTITTGSLAAASWINVPIVTGAGNAFAMSGAVSSNGDTVILNVTDQGAGSGTWRVTGIVANSSSNLYSVSIERLA